MRKIDMTREEFDEAVQLLKATHSAEELLRLYSEGAANVIGDTLVGLYFAAQTTKIFPHISIERIVEKNQYKFKS